MTKKNKGLSPFIFLYCEVSLGNYVVSRGVGNKLDKAVYLIFLCAVYEHVVVIYYGGVSLFDKREVHGESLACG